MARKYVKSRPGLFGMVYYYDENGRSIGKSRPGLIEGTRVYTDQNGRYAGKSRPGFYPKRYIRIPTIIISPPMIASAVKSILRTAFL